MLVILSFFFLKIDHRIPVYVLDTGIKEHYSYFCKDGLIDLTKKGMNDNVGHGWMVSKLIADSIDTTKYCISMVKWCDKCDSEDDSKNDFLVGLAYILKKYPKYLNISSGGKDRDYDEERILRLMQKKGTKITLAAGNDNQNLDKGCYYYPACYHLGKNFHVIGSNKNNGWSKSNYGAIVEEYLDGYFFDNNKKYYGTSFSAPRAMAKIINKDNK